MTLVEFDITEEQLTELQWEQGDAVQISDATWKIENISLDNRLHAVWVTMRKLEA